MYTLEPLFCPRQAHFEWPDSKFHPRVHLGDNPEIMCCNVHGGIDVELTVDTDYSITALDSYGKSIMVTAHLQPPHNQHPERQARLQVLDLSDQVLSGTSRPNGE
ncbi:hypothetical protein [Pectobacterium atrosepticum]|uniref:hypothetical protein n=1 Tax=Pectobacterium atrosepticum TaxID=29471 RepID=UPI0020C0BB6E|nr:hypothetical protein [Pectobacterium atrosepticum]